MGAKGYVLRSASNSELYEAIRLVHRGRGYIDPHLSDSITDLLLGKADTTMRNFHVRRVGFMALAGRIDIVLQQALRSRGSDLASNFVGYCRTYDLRGGQYGL